MSAQDWTGQPSPPPGPQPGPQPGPPPIPQRTSRRPRRRTVLIAAVIVAAAVVAAVLVTQLSTDSPASTARRHLVVPAKVAGHGTKVASTAFPQTVRRYLAPLTGPDDRDVLRHGIAGLYRSADETLFVVGVDLRDMGRLADRVVRDGVDSTLQVFMRTASGGFRFTGPLTSEPSGPLGGTMRCSQLELAGAPAATCGWGDESVFVLTIYIGADRSLTQAAADTRALRPQFERE